MKPGREYELLIAKMYTDLEPNAIVKHDDYIFDERAKIARQIDVSIRFQFAGVDHLIIVQVKDYRHSANIKVVDEFRTVITDVNANKGILVCSKGFSKAALSKAKSYGIECLTVHSAIKKNWETLLKIPVRHVIHEFEIEHDFRLYIAHKAGKSVSLIPQSYSFDGINIIGLPDVIMKLIIAKMGWGYIVNAPIIKLDLKKSGLYHSFDNELLPITEGFISIKFKKSTLKKFYIDPINYLYSADHINGNAKLHNLTISKDTLDSIIADKHSNNKEISEDPIINVTTYDFGGHKISSFILSVPGLIEGEYFIKDNNIMSIDDHSKAIVNLENYLKSRRI